MNVKELQQHVTEQNKAIARLANAIATTYGGGGVKMIAMIQNREVLEVIGKGGFHVLERLGDILNMMDAVTGKDEEMTTPILERSRAMFGGDK